jgi:hypothetical protein
VRVCRSLIFYPSGRICYGYGFLDKTKLSASRRNREETILANLPAVKDGSLVMPRQVAMRGMNPATGLISPFSYLMALAIVFAPTHWHERNVTTFVCFTDPARSNSQAASGEDDTPPEHHERDPSSYRPYSVARTAVARPRHFASATGDGLWEEAPRVAEMDATARLQALIVTRQKNQSE